MEKLGRYVWARVGHCAYCTMRSFQAAALAWIAVVLVWMLPVASVIAGYAVLIAGAATALWLAHVFAFGTKVWISKRDKVDAGRREAFSTIARAALFAASASMVAGVAQASNRAGDNNHCPVAPCTGGTICCSKDCGLGRTAYHCCSYNDCIRNVCPVNC